MPPEEPASLIDIQEEDVNIESSQVLSVVDSVVKLVPQTPEFFDLPDIDIEYYNIDESEMEEAGFLMCALQ